MKTAVAWPNVDVVPLGLIWHAIITGQKKDVTLKKAILSAKDGIDDTIAHKKTARSLGNRLKTYRLSIAWSRIFLRR